MISAAAALALLGPPAVYAASPYLGEADAVVVATPGCNSTAFAQLPREHDLFIGRQLLTVDGDIAGISGPNDCSGGNPDNQKAGKVFNRWSLTLNRLDWRAHKFSLVKPVLDTSIDPHTGHSRAAIGSPGMRGAVIRSAYDASVVVHRGQYIVAYECTLEEPRYGVDGTSACISVYDPVAQVIDLERTQVIVSGSHDGGRFYAAAVPELLLQGGRLFLYWSALVVERGKFTGIAVRGAELEAGGATFSVKGSGGHLVHSIDEGLTMEVWAPNAADPLSNTTVDIRAVWATGDSVVAMASLGGAGCAAPSDKSPGCFRLGIVRSRQALGEGIFNRAAGVNEVELPTNPQEYTRPIRDPGGNYWFIGHYIRPQANGASDRRPVPNAAYWQSAKADSVLAMYPILDKALWPSE